MTPTINLLIVDDHDLLREGIVARLSDVSNIKIIGQGCNGKEAIALCKEHEPDVLLMDISMPEMNGLEAAKEIVTTQHVFDIFSSFLLTDGLTSESIGE